MTQDSTNAPSPAPERAVSDTLNVGQQWAASVRELAAQRELPDERIRFFEEMARFAERTGCACVTGRTINLWGYGDVQIAFADNHGNWWAPLTALAEPTGIPFTDLLEMYQEEVEDGADDVEILSWVVTPGDAGERDICFLEFVGPGFAMRAMMSGPWGKEFAAALMPTFRRAIVSSGLDENIGPVVRIRKDGTAEQTDMTFGEFMAQGEPLPSHEEARESAFRGPAGAL